MKESKNWLLFGPIRLVLMILVGIILIPLFIRSYIEEKHAKKILESTLHCKFSNRMEVNIKGENTTDFTFRDDEDWKKILRFINADPNADFEYYHCSRKQDAFRYDCYVDIEERLLQIRINQTEADDKNSNSQWVICPTSHFMGLGREL